MIPALATAAIKSGLAVLGAGLGIGLIGMKGSFGYAVADKYQVANLLLETLGIGACQAYEHQSNGCYQ